MPEPEDRTQADHVLEDLERLGADDDHAVLDDDEPGWDPLDEDEAEGWDDLNEDEAEGWDDLDEDADDDEEGPE